MTQTVMFDYKADVDKRWIRHAIRECTFYGTHGEYTENVAGASVCVDCRQMV